MLLPLLLFLLPPAQDPAAAILGTWEGTSICVKAEWNRACHDEVTRYEFVPDSVRRDVIVAHAYKRVGEAWEWMGDVDVRYQGSARRWAGEWQNSRVHIEWSYWLEGTEMRGKVEIFPDRRKGRDVVAHRVAT